MTANGSANLIPGANLGGRPVGSRSRLSTRLIPDLAEIWEANGPEILKRMGSYDPSALARMAYATLPKDILVSVEQRIPGGLEPDDWALLQQVLSLIKSAIPPGSNAPPGEVFGVIESALRAHFARQIEPN